MEKTISFAQKMIEQEGGDIRFVTMKEKGKPCWCYLRITPEKWQSYKQALRHGSMNIRDYGEMLKSGWGAYPPASVIVQINEEYDYTTPPQIKE